MKKGTVEILKIIINCITIPLYFIKVFGQQAVIAGVDADGERVFHRYNVYYSVYTKLDGMTILVWGAIAIAIVSIVLSVLSLKIEDNKALKISSHLAFCVSVAVCCILFFIAWTIRYCF